MADRDGATPTTAEHNTDQGRMEISPSPTASVTDTRPPISAHHGDTDARADGVQASNVVEKAAVQYFDGPPTAGKFDGVAPEPTTWR